MDTPGGQILYKIRIYFLPAGLFSSQMFTSVTSKVDRYVVHKILSEVLMCVYNFVVQSFGQEACAGLLSDI